MFLFSAILFNFTFRLSGNSASAVSLGRYHTCVLLSAGNGVKCWGDNRYGQLGIGDLNNQYSPVDVSLNAGMNCQSKLTICMKSSGNL